MLDRIQRLNVEKTTEGIIPAIHRMAKEILALKHSVFSLKQLFGEKIMEELMEKVLNFKGSLWTYKGKTYMVQQPMESHNID